ncbi:restriction endonuclease subunit S [Candidatus Daviesbacteria bacterium]|nr:restriction endonuclease subunit S [Candidatus Daviesbacteria bacterium]
MIRLESNFDPIFVYVYLISKYGRALVNQRITGTVPTSIDKESVRGILIPIPSVAVTEHVKKLIGSHLNAVQTAYDLYQQSENLLLEKLGLKDFQVEDNLSCVVRLSNVKSVSRIDAEYFQLKFQNLIERVEKHNAKRLGDLISMEKGFEPGSEAYQEEGKLFIRVSSVSRFGIEDKDQKYLSEDLYKKLQKDFEPKIGEILLTKDATPGIAYVLKEPVEGIISGGILRLKVKDNIDPEYLALCMSSIIGQWQAERDAGGSIIAHWKPEQIRNILVPVLPKPIQEKIAELVRKSHEARKKSKGLLEEAKRKVEEMIEKGGE